MRAWTILIFLILFSLSLNVVGALGVFQTPSGEAVISEGSDIFSGLDPDSWNLFTVMSTSVGLIGGFAAYWLNLNVGAVVYAGLFSGVSVSIGGFIEQINQATSSIGFAISDPMQTMFATIIVFVFVWGFIKLSS